MAKIEFTKNFDFKGIIEGRLPEIERGLSVIAQNEKTIIDARTNSGRDATGKVFKAYKPSTVSYKRNKGQQISPPNLTDTGNMLQSLTTSTSTSGNKIEALIFTVGQANKVKYNEELGRTFLGLDKNQIARIELQISNLIKG